MESYYIYGLGLYMFFILSKLLLVFIFPVTWVLMLMLWALLSNNKKHKKRAFVSSLIVLYLFSSGLLLHIFSKLWDIKTNLESQKIYSCVIVLGGYVSQDPNGNGFFNTSAHRFFEGLKLLKSGKVMHIAVTGGNASLTPDHFSEGTWAKQQLLALNIPDTSILMEGRSRNTEENAKYIKLLLQQRHLQPPYVLVTSGFHMRRALSVFRKENIDVVPDGSIYTSSGSISFADLIPDAENLSAWQLYIKEVVGLLVVKLKH